MMAQVISVDKLSKLYRLGQFNTGALSQDIQRQWALWRGKEDPFLKLGESNDRTSKGESNVVWSLRDVSFDVNQGDTIGVIGKNGAGKSTLLKLLSRVTSPTTGQIKVKGSVASLLEVGTGFHPELTGRENIYLNGAILGMRKKEINDQLDAIVEFAGVARYLETPVKRYSSGMFVRLGFAVAAHLRSDILIVDEVLAVGDAEFQKKCLGKMNSLSKGEGRTVLFVSHNMSSVSNLCKKSILLEHGQVKMYEDTSKVINQYLNGNTKKESKVDLTDGKLNHLGPKKFSNLRHIELQSEEGNDNNFFSKGAELSIIVKFDISLLTMGIELGLGVSNENGFVCGIVSTFDEFRLDLEEGSYEVKIDLGKLELIPSTYFITPYLKIAGGPLDHQITNAITFEIVGEIDSGISYKGYSHLGIHKGAKWEMSSRN